jgi:hypothetical protein
MNPSVIHRLRNILAVILGGIQTGNLELAKQAVHQAESCLAAAAAVSGERQDVPTPALH